MKEKKIGILTINDNCNYGNRLQNYAVQEILKRQKVKVETICNNLNYSGIKHIKKDIMSEIKRILPIKKIYKRQNKFSKFNKNIKFSRYYIDKYNIPRNLGKKYDTFVIGSDQVWNPNFGRMSDIDFLTFAPKEKRNSFSASFGIKELPSDMKEYYKNNLLEFNNISVREETGKEIIEKLTDRDDVEVLVDPTLLLTTDEWDKVSKKPKNLKTDKYILTYFLGNLSDSRKKEIYRIAKENECEVINIMDENSPFYQTGPSEFIYLEKHSFLVCTDSFHASVFALLYNKPFIIFDREDDLVNMNSRIDNLIEKFKLKDRKFNIGITKENLEHDYGEAYKILDEERSKSENFIRKILNEE